MVDKIYNIKYVDAYYGYAKKVGVTKLTKHDAYGYVEKNGDNIIITFIKKRGVRINDLIKNSENIVKGLVIPDTALTSVVATHNTELPKDVSVGVSVAITWRDIVYVANLPRYNCSVMYTEGVVFRIEKDHIVLKNPETIRLHPRPIKNHPEKKPATYLVIPRSFITDVVVH